MTSIRTRSRAGSLSAMPALAAPSALESVRMPDTSPDPDRKPSPPERPEPADCCQGGCERCVYDLYEEAMDRYREALRVWEALAHPNDRGI